MKHLGLAEYVEKESGSEYFLKKVETKVRITGTSKNASNGNVGELKGLSQ